MHTHSNYMTLSTRIHETLSRRISGAVKGAGVSPADLVREGLARVLSEYESTGVVRFGVSARCVSVATDSAASRTTPRKTAARKHSTGRAA